METIAYKLVEHNYDERTLGQVYSINELKRTDFEWNKESRSLSPVNKELDIYDIGYSIRNIDNSSDEYGFCFVNEQQLPSGNYAFSTELLILDTNLPESIIHRFAASIVRNLASLHRESVEDTYRTDRIIGVQNLPLSPLTMDSTILSFYNSVLTSYKSSRDGIVPISEEQKIHFKEIAAKMNNAPE